MDSFLPVDDLHADFQALRSGRCPRIVASPTGSGKSTRVPRWCSETGTVLVVEPRRVAARALARRVAFELGTPVGEEVGYAVRDDARRGPRTRILFVTPGVALKMLASGDLESWDTWILDEFHERRAETDLLLALARHRDQAHRIVILSATLNSGRLAAEMGAQVLTSEGRTFPVDIEYLPAPDRSLPDPAGLPLRIERALARLEAQEGTVLVFLPGVGEIHEAFHWLEGRVDADLLVLHGQLPPESQDRCLAPGPAHRVRVILATNVAESALTVPDVVAVVDSGLERRMVRTGGLRSLSLEPISRSSADQRTGRAGRLRPGRCLRLWSSSARLAPHHPPEVQVDEPDDWLLPSLATGISPRDLPWLDRPLATALREAQERIESAGLWDADPWSRELPAGGRLTRRGSDALDLPLSPALAGFCLDLLGTPAACDAAGLAAALDAGRPLLRPRPRPDQIAARREIGQGGGDAALLSRLVRLSEGEALDLGIHLPAWREASDGFLRLAERLQLSDAPLHEPFQARSVLRAWGRIFPRSLRLRRGNAGREEYALGGGAAWWLSKDSLAFSERPPEALLVLSFHGGEDRSGKSRIWIDAAAALTRKDCLELEAGRAEILHAECNNGILKCRLRRKVAGTPLGETDALPTHPALLGQVLARARSDLREVESLLELHWREVCIVAGRWIPPPGGALDWIAREETRRHDPMAALLEGFPHHTPRPPVSDAQRICEVFPETWITPMGTFPLRADALTGRITLIPDPGAPRPRVQDLPRPSLWQDWTLVWGKPSGK